MKKYVVIALVGALLATVSFAVGVGATILYLAKPVKDWQHEFSETMFTAQSEALRELRAGKQESALQYLELVATRNLNEAGKDFVAGDLKPRTYSFVQELRYLCKHPPLIPGASSGQPPSVTESCTQLASLYSEAKR